LTATGGVKCWGAIFNSNGEPTESLTPTDVVGLDSGIVAITSGDNYDCAVTAAGGVKCWGDNRIGQLGIGMTNDTLNPPTDVVGLTAGVSDIAAGFQHTCALTVEKGVKCWNQRWDQPGLVAVIGLESGVKALAAGYEHSCALMETGHVKCWGWNQYGQLGRGFSSYSVTPVNVARLPFGSAADAGDVFRRCAPTSEGPDGCANAQVAEGSGEIALESPLIPLASMEHGGFIVSGANADHSCALLRNGVLKCWGRNNRGQLGIGERTFRIRPVVVDGLNEGIIAVATGGLHTCALTTTKQIKCWGDNRFGQLGDAPQEEPRLTPGSAVSGLPAGTVAVTAGPYHSCALTEQGGVNCWGINSTGQLGDGTREPRVGPVAVVGLESGIQTLTAGASHTCALTVAGGVKCWGNNNTGQLGVGSTDPLLAPADVIGLPTGIIAVRAGQYHTCALADDGRVWCWGDNSTGQLGDGSTGRRLLPVAVGGLPAGTVGITAGSGHSCALSRGGTVWCWGINRRGQLGDETTENRLKPVRVSGISAAIPITAGATHTCAVTRREGAKCWGSNATGQHGTGISNTQSVPSEVLVETD